MNLVPTQNIERAGEFFDKTDRYKILLTRFDYYVSVDGVNGGGLFELRTEFSFVMGRKVELEEQKRALRQYVSNQETIFDTLFGNLMSGTKSPTLTDSPHSTRIGIRYRGTPTEEGYSLREKTIQALFGMQDPLLQKVDLHSNHDVKINYELPSTSDLSSSDPCVNITVNMDHGLNVCWFKLLNQQEAIEIDKSVIPSMQKLERVLQELTSQSSQFNNGNFRS